MKDWQCPADAICPDEPTCMYCGRKCEKTEVVWTGDDESYAGFELWCYCEHCKTDTFHKLIKQPTMEEKIKELIDEYSKRVEREIIGCGLGAYSEDLKKEVDDIVQNLFYKTVGTRPSDSDSDEYTEWYKKTLVFGEIVSEFGKRYSRYHEYFNTPKELKNNYGPRD